MASAEYQERCPLPNLVLASAAENGDETLKKMIAKKRLHINSPNRCGVTALHTAAGGGRVDAVRILLKNGADINIQSKAGSETPLHWACMGTFLAGFTPETVEVVQLLLEKGADPTIKDDLKRSALTVAKMFKNREVTKLVQLHYNYRIGKKCRGCGHGFGFLPKVRDRFSNQSAQMKKMNSPLADRREKMTMDEASLRRQKKIGIFRCKRCTFLYCRNCVDQKSALFDTGMKKEYRGICTHCLEGEPMPNCEWSTSTHTQFPERIKRQVKTVLLMAQVDHETMEPRHPECPFAQLPRDILHQILKTVAEPSE